MALSAEILAMRTPQEAQAWLDSPQSISPPDLQTIDTEDTIFVSAKPPVIDLLHSPNDHQRQLAMLATREEIPAGIIAQTLIENNGALPIDTLNKITGISPEQVTQVSETFIGHITVYKGKRVVVADALLPIREGEEIIFSHPPKLAKAG